MKLSIKEQAKYWNYRASVDKGISGSLWQGRTVWNWYINMYHHFLLLPFFARIKPGQSVLDVGCGVGRFVKQMTRRTRITGIDISPEAVRRCRVIAPKSCFFVGSATDMNLPDDSFDWVFSITTLCCITNRSEFTEAAGEIVRVLKPGGKAVFFEHLDADNNSEMIVNISRDDFILMLERFGLKIKFISGFDIPVLRTFLEMILARTPTRVLKEIITALYLPFLLIAELSFTDINFEVSKYSLIYAEKEV